MTGLLNETNPTSWEISSESLTTEREVNESAAATSWTLFVNSTDRYTTLGVTADLSTAVYYPAGLPSGYTWAKIVITSIAVSFLLIVIIIGNFLVCVAIYTDRNLKTTQNSFIASLAIADLLLGLIIMPFSLANELMGYWFFGPVWCDLWLSMDVLLSTASILNLCLISLDRYWSITRALHYPRQRTPRRAALMIATVWILSAIVCFPPLIGWKQPQPVGTYPLCVLSDDVGYVIYSSAGSFYIPMIIMVIVYFRIYLAARSRARKTVQKPKIVCPVNGKDKSTSSTTTSFTTPPKNNNQKNMAPVPPPDRDLEESSFSEDETTRVKDSLEIPSTKQNQVHVVIADEKRKLLQTDSDSMESSAAKFRATSDSEVGEVRPTGKQLILVTDTESSLESPGLPIRQGEHSRELKPVSENAKKPFLQDSDSTCVDSSLLSPGETGVSDTADGKSPELDRRERTSASKQEKGKAARESGKGKKSVLPLANFRNIMSKSSSSQDKTRKEQTWKVPSARDTAKQKRRLAKARERRATIVLGLVMAAFILCWCPFFTLYVVSAFCRFCISEKVFNIFFWIGYCNSALNPVIYTVFNRDFRLAFKKIVCGRSERH